MIDRGMTDEARKRVLVVDDDAVQTGIVVRILERVGYECLTASSVAQAKARMTANAFDAVVTDLRLAGDDGTDVVRHCKLHYPGTKVVVTTGVLDAEVDRSLVDSGASAVLHKPFDMQDLRGVLEQLC